MSQAQVAEVAAVSAHFAAPSGLAATGATVAGVKYMFVRGEENAEIYVKKVGALPRACFHPTPPTFPCRPRSVQPLRPVSPRPCCSQGATGVCFCRCNTCIIVGYHDDKIQPGSCQMTVGKLADFLKESGI